MKLHCSTEQITCITFPMKTLRRFCFNTTLILWRVIVLLAKGIDIHIQMVTFCNTGMVLNLPEASTNFLIISRNLIVKHLLQAKISLWFFFNALK